MSQPQYAMEYLGAISVVAGEVYTIDNVLTDFPTANMMKMKTDGVKVSINGTDAFLVSFNDESYISSGKTYIFSQPCTIVVGRYVIVT